MEAQKASIAASETKLAEMRRTMKIAMQRFTDMKSMIFFTIIALYMCVIRMGFGWLEHYYTQLLPSPL